MTLIWYALFVRETVFHYLRNKELVLLNNLIFPNSPLLGADGLNYSSSAMSHSKQVTWQWGYCRINKILVLPLHFRSQSAPLFCLLPQQNYLGLIAVISGISRSRPGPELKLAESAFYICLFFFFLKKND